jgi:hypothetical protein
MKNRAESEKVLSIFDIVWQRGLRLGQGGL